MIYKVCLVASIGWSSICANDIGLNGAVNANYGNSYDFYDFSENL